MAKRTSKPKSKPIEKDDTGVFADLAGRPNPKGLVIVVTPSLAALFAYAEREKGDRLSPTEAARIRDRAPAIAVTPKQAAALVESRGYEDVDPAHPYESWLRMNAD
jgi:hypothetical protein